MRTLFSGAPRTASLAFLVFLIDQLSKWAIVNVVMAPPRDIAITSFFNIVLGFNSGISFGMLRDAIGQWPGLVALLSAVIGLAMLLWSFISNDKAEKTGLAMIAGGAFGNAFDRWRQGAVTDFLDFHLGALHWPAFNMADVAIVCGVALIFVSAFSEFLRSRRKPPALPADNLNVKS